MRKYGGLQRARHGAAFRLHGAAGGPRVRIGPVALALVLTASVLVTTTFASGANAQTVGSRDMSCAGKTLLQSALVLATAVASGEATTVKCDVDNDGKITNRDARALQECDLGLKSYRRCVNAGVELPPLREEPAYYDDAIDFTEDLATPVNVSGALRGHLGFIQATYVTPSGNIEQNRPDLVPDREALLLFFPTDNNEHAISAQIGNSHYELAPPENQPHHDGPLGNEAMVYSKRAWSAIISAEDMAPGMSIEFTDGDGNVGSIAANAFTFGAPMEMTSIAVSMGMLTGAPSTALHMEGLNAEISLDYFNKIPVTKYRLAQYEKIELDRVVLPDGTVYVGQSAKNGSWLGGDMRFYIAKLLIGSGVARANLGIPAFKGKDENEPRPFRQSTIINARGRYTSPQGNPANATHCCSGGAGQVLLLGARGNEFSHELGHDYGLPHGPGGKTLRRHNFTGGWGYDVLRDRLIANVRWENPSDGPLPWEFNTDAMSGGKNSGSVSFYTLHTPYSLRLIQRNLQTRGWLDDSSPTGYSAWDYDNQKVVPYTDRLDQIPKREYTGVRITTIAGFYDPQAELTSWMMPALHANWGITYTPKATNETTGYSDTCTLTVKGNGPDRVFNLADQRLDRNQIMMNAFHVNVPARFRASKAIVQCGNEELVARDLEPPTGELGAVIEVGGDAGIEATLRVALYEPTHTTSLQSLERELSLHYGVPIPYKPSSTTVPGQLYSYKGAYYQARKAVNTAPPGGPWRRIVANGNDYVHDTTIGLGEKSKTYESKDSGFGFVVKVDGREVLASDVERVQRKDTSPYGFVTVGAIGSNGELVPVKLRVQLNESIISSNAPNKGKPSYFTATFVPEDNPKLKAGTYDVDFEVIVWARHLQQSTDALRVVDSITVN